jgi:hypothetical protein
MDVLNSEIKILEVPQESTPVLYTKKGTVRKRKPKEKKQYFTQETEDAIIAYLASTDSIIRNKIYNEHIKYAFHKLTENIIHTFKFYYTEVETIAELQHEVTAFLLEKLHLYDQSKGKAYSYFGTIAKRYLILSNDKNYRKKVESIDIDNFNDDGTDFSNGKELESSLKYDIETSDKKGTKTDQLSYFIDKFVIYCSDNIYTLFPKNNDAKIADAILELFRKRENIDIFNKKAIYIYIKEIIDIDTSQITKVSKKLYDIFNKSYIYYLEHEIIKF